MRTRLPLETLKSSFSFFLSNQKEWFTFQYQSYSLKHKEFTLKKSKAYLFLFPSWTIAVLKPLGRAGWGRYRHWRGEGSHVAQSGCPSLRSGRRCLHSSSSWCVQVPQGGVLEPNRCGERPHREGPSRVIRSQGIVGWLPERVKAKLGKVGIHAEVALCRQPEPMRWVQGVHGGGRDRRLVTSRETDKINKCTNDTESRFFTVSEGSYKCGEGENEPSGIDWNWICQCEFMVFSIHRYRNTDVNTCMCVCIQTCIAYLCPLRCQE